MHAELSLNALLWVYGLVLVPLALMHWFRLGLLRSTVVGLVRMTVQLGLVGLYLHVIFDLQSLALNLLWMLVMLVTATHAVLAQARLKKRALFVATLTGTSFSAVGVTLIFVAGIIQPTPLYDARYLIPIFGMILGNTMRANVLSLERFYRGIRAQETTFITYQTLGATVAEASRPFMTEALQATIGPYIATMATMGIVSLPGMMTGQILGGAPPDTAIKYQIAIMVCILTTLVVGTVLNLTFSRRVAFDAYGMLRQDIFAEE